MPFEQHIFNLEQSEGVNLQIDLIIEEFKHMLQRDAYYNEFGIFTVPMTFFANYN